MQYFDDIFIVIDALDECPEADQTRKNFLTEVRSLLPDIRLMVTSRHIPSIENTFREDLRLEIRASDQDIKSFIESQTVQQDNLMSLLEDHDDLRDSILTAVLGKANGM